MKVHNIRFGFATNSSSSHSIVLMPGPRPQEVPADADYYGWEDFTLVSKASKFHYVASMLYEQLERRVSPEIAKAIIAQLFRTKEDPKDIDHQSRFNFPLDWHGGPINDQFLADFVKFVSRPDVVILGGNDNSEGHPLAETGRPAPVAEFITRSYRAEAVARKDGDTWVIFNRETGAKLRFSFDENAPEYTESRWPELVDLSITDQCYENCAYCYRDSTPAGKHANYGDVYRILEALAERRVFEVALGGGNPVLHPNLIGILRTAKRLGVTPNLTVHNLSWLENYPIRTAIQETCGGVAVSVSSLREALQVAGVRGAASYGDPNIGTVIKAIQVIPELVYEDTFREILQVASKADLTVTLLGYKSVGRASRHAQPHKDYDWVKIAKDAHVRLGVDTTLAESSQRLLKKHEIPDYLYTLKDGRFSCFIDAVGMTVHASSYETARKGHPFDEHTFDAVYRAFANG